MPISADSTKLGARSMAFKGTYRSHRLLRALQKVQARETLFIGVAFLSAILLDCITVSAPDLSRETFLVKMGKVHVHVHKGEAFAASPVQSVLQSSRVRQRTPATHPPTTPHQCLCSLSFYPRLGLPRSCWKPVCQCSSLGPAGLGWVKPSRMLLCICPSTRIRNIR